MMFGLSTKAYNIILDLFRRYGEIEKAILFGSRAKGNFKSGSDVDIALMGEKVNTETAFAVSGRLNEELTLPWFFDVLDYNSISNIDLKEHIDRVGKVIYEK